MSVISSLMELKRYFEEEPQKYVIFGCEIVMRPRRGAVESYETRLRKGIPSEEVNLILRGGIVNIWSRGTNQIKKLIFYLTEIVLFQWNVFQHFYE
jgi:hypothetical protein